VASARRRSCRTSCRSLSPWTASASPSALPRAVRSRGRRAPDRRLVDDDSALEFRIEWGSAGDHLATVDKRVLDLVARQVRPKTLVCITHNMYEFEDPDDPHRQTLTAVAERIGDVGHRAGLPVVARTLAQIHETVDAG
jgi:hypothetical protein